MDLKMNNGFADLSVEEMEQIDGGMPIVLGVLAAGGIIAGTAGVVGGATYAVKRLCQYVGSKF